MRRVARKWRPSLWLVLGGGLAGTLALAFAGLVALRYLGPEIGFKSAAAILGTLIALGTAVLGWLLWRLLARPITALADHAQALRRAQPGRAPTHFGTRELQTLGDSVLAMADTLQNRAATIRSFTDHATHELKTPVTTIKAAAELLADSPDVTDPDRTLARQILTATDQMHSQLAALRSMSQAREASYHGTCTLTDALPDPTPLPVIHDAPGTPIPLAAEGLRIVLHHLLTNAAQAGASRATLALHTADDTLTLTLADTGPGISPGNQAHLFEPFFTTRREAGGTGMGLAIAASILRAHNADIAYIPGPTGAKFQITFPELA